MAMGTGVMLMPAHVMGIIGVVVGMICRRVVMRVRG
jgi:hypothetical protein